MLLRCVQFLSAYLLQNQHLPLLSPRLRSYAENHVQSHEEVRLQEVHETDPENLMYMRNRWMHRCQIIKHQKHRLSFDELEAYIYVVRKTFYFVTIESEYGIS